MFKSFRLRWEWRKTRNSFSLLLSLSSLFLSLKFHSFLVFSHYKHRPSWFPHRSLSLPLDSLISLSLLTWIFPFLSPLFMAATPNEVQQTTPQQNLPFLSLSYFKWRNYPLRLSPPSSPSSPSFSRCSRRFKLLVQPPPLPSVTAPEPFVASSPSSWPKAFCASVTVKLFLLNLISPFLPSPAVGISSAV